MKKTKIFASVGTHPQQFDRLLKELDRIAGKNTELELFAQAGNCTYSPKNFGFKKFLNDEEYGKKISEADIVISHGGAGTIISSMLQRKKLIVVPRLQRYGEHTNDHQIDLAEALAAEGKVIAVKEIGLLEEAIKKAAAFKPNIASNKAGLVKAIGEFIGNI
ncbi:MAG: glycosyltransferase [Candidatus Diapherotrites archaeon]|nr:glycosyltransferase [Candidatus Diapherotrites archaeon]